MKNLYLDITHTLFASSQLNKKKTSENNQALMPSPHTLLSDNRNSKMILMVNIK